MSNQSTYIEQLRAFVSHAEGLPGELKAADVDHLIVDIKALLAERDALFAVLKGVIYTPFSTKATLAAHAVIAKAVTP